MTKLLGVALYLMLFSVSHTNADTIYYYTGTPYTRLSGTPSTGGLDPAVFGTNLTASVTFNFDTTGFTGTIYANPEAFGIYDQMHDIQQIQLMSGGLSVVISHDQLEHISGSTDFLLNNGAVTQWNILTTVIPIGTIGIGWGSNNAPPLSFTQGQAPFGGGDIVEQQCLGCFFNGGSAGEAYTPTPGTWSGPFADVPAPIMGTGFPALLPLAVGLLAWWRRGRKAA